MEDNNNQLQVPWQNQNKQRSCSMPRNRIVTKFLLNIIILNWVFDNTEADVSSSCSTSNIPGTNNVINSYVQMAHVSPADVKDQSIGSSGFLCRNSCLAQFCTQSSTTETYHLPSEGGFICETDGINGVPSLASGIKVGSKTWN